MNEYSLRIMDLTHEGSAIQSIYETELILNVKLNAWTFVRWKVIIIHSITKCWLGIMCFEIRVTKWEPNTELVSTGNFMVFILKTFLSSSFYSWVGILAASNLDLSLNDSAASFYHFDGDTFILLLLLLLYLYIEGRNVFLKVSLNCY